MILSKTALVAKLKRVPVYPNQIAAAVRHPKYAGAVQNANAVGADARLDCGCFVRMEIRIGGIEPQIDAVSYTTNGCGFMVASAELLSSQLASMKLTDLNAQLEVTENMSRRSGCETAVFTAVKIAFAEYRARKVEEFRGEKALICTCFGIEEETLERFLRSEDVKDITEVMQRLRAGSGCGSCRMLIQEIIDANG